MMALARRALPMTFVIYGIEALLGLYAVLPGALELAPALALALGDDGLVEALGLETLLDLAGVARVSLRALGLAGLAVLVLGPWLQMSWLSALAQRGSVQSAFAAGARLTPRAWLVSLWVLLLAALCVAPVLGAAYGVHRWLAAPVAARTHDIVLAGVLALLLPILCIAHVLHDVARARALHLRATRSALGGLRLALRPRMCSRAALAWGFGIGALALATWAGPHLSGSRTASLTTLSLLQSALLARLFARSWWLACAVLQIGQLAAEVSVVEEA